MQEIKKKNGGAGGNEDSRKKERHIVTWTQEEDDILREQISLHGTENWAIIASKFKDKTTRQCRRRWYTYLNSDFKKGGWSPEEDMLLCEAQKIFGNRWTEIAKVVSGRTDNAVKNRFSTLCKKRAKYEALAKENTTSCINPNNKRVLLQDGFNTDGITECTAPIKRMRRSHISDLSGDCNFGDRAHRVSGTVIDQQLRHPFSVLGQNLPNVNNVVVQSQADNVKEVSNEAQNNRTQGTFLKKDDPKITALMQQAELLSSLALKVNTDNTEQSLENAWKVLQDFLNQSKGNDTFRHTISDIDFQLEDFKDLLEDLRSTNEGSRPSWRQPDLYEASPASSEYSTGSTLMPLQSGEKEEQTQAKTDAMQQDILSSHIGGQNCRSEEEKAAISSANTSHVEIIPPCDDQSNIIVASTASNAEFSSPVQVTLLFRSLAAGIPSPKFSDAMQQDILSSHIGEQNCRSEEEKAAISSANTSHVEIIPPCDDQSNIIVASTTSNAEFSSPVQVTPLFRSLAAGIPSPKFSESERNFLLKTLGMESPSPNPANNLSQPPPCKRVLLHSL